ncbi:MerR family transcriptional regulator [Eubacteriales bacterium OttesenSCG-928-M02]|nr:MerR family transcriptional regulator [Eubacteriales bacterium OttesenSCG-928-M02]
MEYTVKKLAQIANISPRTLRYYDEIGLLKPKRISSSGYRIYGKDEVDMLQQILFYRELGLRLEDIATIIKNPTFNREAALQEHLTQLTQRRDQLDRLIQTVKRTIGAERGENAMNDQEKFEGFKRELIQENEQKYGEEIRAKYGEETVAKSNARMMHLTQQEYDAMQRLSSDILEGLKQAVLEQADPLGELGQRLASMHRDWLGYTWGEYSYEAHKGLCQMYLEDTRFSQYYDSEIPGCAQFLRDAVYGLGG